MRNQGQEKDVSMKGNQLSTANLNVEGENEEVESTALATLSSF